MHYWAQIQSAKRGTQYIWWAASFRIGKSWDLLNFILFFNFGRRMSHLLFLWTFKGQIILKCLFGVFNFVQKTNKNKLTWGFIVCSKVQFVRVMDHWRHIVCKNKVKCLVSAVQHCWFSKKATFGFLEARLVWQADSELKN